MPRQRPKNEKFKSDIIVSKPVAVITFKTRYKAAKVKHVCILDFMIDKKVEDPKNEGFETL